MALTIVENRRAITGGAGTHADTHVAAALDPVRGAGRHRGVPRHPAGYARLLSWLGGYGTVALVGIEGAGSYGAGLARHITAVGVRVVEAGRSGRQDRRRQGKPRPAGRGQRRPGRPVGRPCGAPKGRDGAVEAIRALMVARRSARAERTQTVNQARSLLVTGPGDLRARFAGYTVVALVSGMASLRPRPGSTVGYATRIALRELGRRAEFPGGQPGSLDELIIPPGTTRSGCEVRRPGRTCARPPRSPPRRGGSPNGWTVRKLRGTSVGSGCHVVLRSDAAARMRDLPFRRFGMARTTAWSG